MKLLIPPDPLDLIDWGAATNEEWHAAEEAHFDWLWKWKREVVSSFSCNVYGPPVRDVIEPHAYDLVDYYHSREVRLGNIPREYWE